jgi:hypothetical protein
LNATVVKKQPTKEFWDTLSEAVDTVVKFT